MNQHSPQLQLHDAIKCRSARVSIIGLGYVGLPLSMTAVDGGFTVSGHDINDGHVEALNRGQSAIHAVSDTMLKTAGEAGKFSAFNNFDGLAEADIIIICVPTPISRHREPDLSYVEATTEQIARRLRPGQLIILESTTYPGTTDEIVRPILEKTGLKSGQDFFLGYSPEREDPGNKDYSTRTIPKVVAGDGDTARDLVIEFYSTVIDEVVPVSSNAVAEAVKLTENIFRSVNIALVNELKQIFGAMDIDIWEVIAAAKTKPFGYMPFYPGPGLGGHCIPIDPFYLTWKSREHDLSTRFIELAGEINVAMPHYVIEKLADALNVRMHKALSRSRILLVGMSYKKNVGDLRESPSLKLMQLLEKRNAEVAYTDPCINVLPKLRAYPEFIDRKSVRLEDCRLADFDAALIATDHDDIDYQRLADEIPLIIDTRNVFERLGIKSDAIVKA